MAKKIVKKAPTTPTTWRCYGTVTEYLGTVEAMTEEEAKEKAIDLESAGIYLCHRCSEECEDPEVSEVTVIAE